MQKLSLVILLLAYYAVPAYTRPEESFLDEIVNDVEDFVCGLSGDEDKNEEGPSTKVKTKEESDLKILTETIKDLEKRLAKLEATSKNLPPGPDSEDTIKDIAELKEELHESTKTILTARMKIQLNAGKDFTGTFKIEKKKLEEIAEDIEILESSLAAGKGAGGKTEEGPTPEVKTKEESDLKSLTEKNKELYKRLKKLQATSKNSGSDIKNNLKEIKEELQISTSTILTAKLKFELNAGDITGTLNSEKKNLEDIEMKIKSLETSLAAGTGDDN